MNNIIFALDIGTRSVVGVVGEKIGDTLKVLSVKSILHPKRAMIDGQIEDITAVSKIIGIVKSQLENDLGITLSDVCIAAAGRSLKTQKISINRNLDIRKAIDTEFKNALETEALQAAQEKFLKTCPENTLFYCVGYSVLSYVLDGQSISNIKGHRGNKISIEIIGAFLPHIVVEGLYACMDNNHLNVTNLTLEPIAAMDLIIPSDLRLLNLALIDIGAGTSDIAISKNGSIVGYEMATLAGDEITECIMSKYLVDFDTAENVKSLLSENEDIFEITDILGFVHTISKKEIEETINQPIYDLCKDVSSKIIDINQEPPTAVFLVGGGSKVPFIKDYLSEFLQIPSSRIALSQKHTVRNVDLSSIENFGPEFITPIGIAYSSILNRNYDFFSVVVNGKKVRLYSIRSMKVMDALLMSGFDSKKLIGFSGKSMKFTLNGSTRYHAGEFSTPAQIFVNSKISNIETPLRAGDIVEIIPAVDGLSPIVRISDIVEPCTTGSITFDGIETSLGTRFFVNSTEVSEDFIIGNSDAVEVIQIDTLNSLIDLFELRDAFASYFVNGTEINGDFLLYDGCIIDVYKTTSLVAISDDVQSIDIQVIDAKPLELEPIGKENIDEAPIIEPILSQKYIHVTVNGTMVRLPLKEDSSPYIFADMLNFTDIDPSNPKGSIILMHNGINASYVSLVKNNDEIIIKWDTDNKSNLF